MQFVATLGSSFTYNVNSSGATMLPCGSPTVTGSESAMQVWCEPFTFHIRYTIIFQLFKQNLNIYCIKSFLQIDKTMPVTSPSCMFHSHLSVIFMCEVNVECICLNPNWTRVMRLFSSRKFEKCMCINLSSTLDRTGRIDIGL